MAAAPSKATRSFELVSLHLSLPACRSFARPLSRLSYRRLHPRPHRAADQRQRCRRRAGVGADRDPGPLPAVDGCLCIDRPTEPPHKEGQVWPQIGCPGERSKNRPVDRPASRGGGGAWRAGPDGVGGRGYDGDAKFRSRWTLRSHGRGRVTCPAGHQPRTS